MSELIEKLNNIINDNMWFDCETEEMGVSEEAAQEIIDLVEQSQWVNVNDRLPKLSADVLVYINNDGYNFITVAYLGENGWSEYNNVTHWKSLPHAPITSPDEH